tara:strand:+ start:1170 stop:2084 length:915 start_codon:yes stop_codon:yes gene_type:complete
LKNHLEKKINLKNKILVAGGSGFLGSNLIKALNLKQYDITVLLKTRRTKFIKKEKIKYFVCNIKRKNNFKLIDKKFDYIINFSGNIDHKNKSETMNVHYFGLKNLLNHIDKRYLKLFIQIGSSLEYGRKNSPQKENRKCKPISNYGKAKYLATNYVLKNIKKSIVLRLYQVYGPGQKKDRLIPYVIENCLKNKTFNSSEGLQMRDFLYVDDLVNLIKKILRSKKIKSKIYNVGSGNPKKVKYLINLILKKIKKGKPIFGNIKMRADEIKDLYPNIQNVKKDFKWKPLIELNRGLQKTINYYAKN